MNGKLRIFLALVFVVLLAVPEDVGAWPRRRRRATTYYRPSGGPVSVAQKTDADSGNYQALAAYYDYDRASEDSVAFDRKLRVFLDVRDEAVLSTDGEIVAEIKVAELSNSENTGVKVVPVTLEPNPAGKGRIASFDVTNDSESEQLIKPATVYRLFVNLHRKAQALGESTVLGRVATPYYVATSGPTRLDRARRHVVMRTFKEFYYTEKGWASDENSPLDCHAYYCWALSSCTVGAFRERANLGRLFGSDVPYHRGSDISELAAGGPVAADYVRIPGHTFMILAYDQKQNEVWTMESNFNRSIEVAIRPVGSYWTVGHLVEEHIAPGLFEVQSD